MARTIVVGDIHGCYSELVSLLEKIHFHGDDRLVAVGDLTVKGPRSREVLDLFRRDSRFSSVLGNHDLALVKSWRGESLALKPWQERALRELEDGGDDYFQYLSSRPLYIDLGSHLVVHAGLRPGVALEEQSSEDLTEPRTLGADRTSRTGVPWYEVYAGDKVVLFGHWPAAEPRRGKQAIGLDTGCVYGHRLTAYIVGTGEFLSVAAKTAYSPRAGSDADSNHKASIPYR